MKTIKFRPTHLLVMSILGMHLLLEGAAIVHADEVPQVIRQRIEQEFPGATITGVEEEMWKGQIITEVDFTSQDGIDYEARVSDRGKILTIEEEKGLPLIGGELSIGIGGHAEREIYRGVDSEIQPAPFLKYENGPLEIQAYDGIGASFGVFRTERLSIALTGSLSMNEGYDPDDSEFLKGMDELDTLYGAGMAIEWGYNGWGVELGFVQDLSGEHDGQEVELALGYRWMMFGFEWRPEVSVTWMSEKMVDYFYGVSSKEARTDRPVYSPGSAFEIGAELMIQRPFLDNFTWVGMVEITTLDSEITNSPLVDEDYEIEGSIGVMYTF
jgi:outer membrane protein